MTGQEKILAMRRTGSSPRTVWIDDGFGAGQPSRLTVRLAPNDVPEQQDWRFLVGLTVLVTAHDEARMARIAAACKTFARRVIANLHAAEPVKDAYGFRSFPILKITDTDEVLTWPT